MARPTLTAAALARAEEQAEADGRFAPTTADLLLALAELDDGSARALRRHRVDAAALRRALAVLRTPEPADEGGEPSDAPRRALERAGRLAATLGAREPAALHLLSALAADAAADAARALRAVGIDPAVLRNQIIADLSPERPRGAAGRPPAPAAQAPDGDEPAPSPGPSGDEPWIDLTAMARRGALAPVLGRERELDRLLDLLARREAPRPCVVGEPGVGKSALVRGLAQRLAQGAAHPALAGRRVVALDVAELLAAGQPDGAAALAEVRDAAERRRTALILVLENLHLAVLGAGDAIDPQAELRLLALAADLPCVATTTPEAWRRLRAAVPGLERSFTALELQEPGAAEVRAILAARAPGYATHHGLPIGADAVDAAARLAGRFLSGRALPDRALALVDLAAARARRLGRPRLTPELVATLAGEAAGIPADRLLLAEGERLARLEERLGEAVIGHAAVLRRVAQAVRRGHAGFRSRRPLASFLFLGPSGVGKTETARALAAALFDDERALVRLDMSEYAEPHTVARLLGAPPGYVGHEEGGQLTEAVRRRPHAVLLFDELEKAHRDVQLTLLQLLDEGRLTDGRGRPVDFTSTLVILTSNLGGEVYAAAAAPAGFGAARAELDGPDRLGARVLEAARRALAPELWGRIEEPLVFEPLTPPALRAIARALTAASSRRLEAERGVTYGLDDAAIDWVLAEGGFDPRLGARPMRAALTRLIETAIADEILAGRARAGDHLMVTADERGIAVRRLRAA